MHSVRQNIRDPVGGSVELLLVPLLRLLHTLLLMDVYHHSDLRRVLSLILPSSYMRENDAGELADGDGENDYDIEGEEKEGRALAERKSLLQMKLPEAVKLQVCKTTSEDRHNNNFANIACVQCSSGIISDTIHFYRFFRI